VPGWKLWTRERLSSFELQHLIQDQVVMRFASASARTAALTAPEQGMLTYLEDVHRVELYDGAAWKPWTAAWAQTGGAGFAAGVSPPAGQAFTIQAWSAIVNTNAGGDVTIPYPAAFPSGVSSVQLTPGDVSGNFAYVAGTGVTLSSCTARCYQPGGAAVASIPVRINVLVVGW
jgi:hypothetical protein